MRDRFCWIVVTIQLIVLVLFAYIMGVHAEKIGWLEDQVIHQKGDELWERKVAEKAEGRDVEGLRESGPAS